MASNNDIAAALRAHKAAIQTLHQQLAVQQQMIADLTSRPKSVQEEIDAIEGRRIESMMVGEVTFAATDAGNQGTPVIIQISQDGPFVWTHYPIVMWFPSAPSNATNFNVWRPVSSFPLPTQQVTSDFINLKYSISDGGAGRLFQNAPRAPLFSRPDVLLPCATPTLWSPNSNIIFTPTFMAIQFTGGIPPTQGTLHVAFPGYRIVNL